MEGFWWWRFSPELLLQFGISEFPGCSKNPQRIGELLRSFVVCISGSDIFSGC
jgi:hypothetical protein